MQSSDTYRVSYCYDSFRVRTYCSDAYTYKRRVSFTYVDSNGKYHKVQKAINDFDSLDIISYNQETAIIRTKVNGNEIRYYLLVKESETVSDLPHEFICPCNKINY